MVSYSFEDIEKLGKKFSESKIIGDTWLYGHARDFYEILKSLELEEGNRVLYVGTGSGYGSYVISNLVSEVFSYEINKDEMKEAKENIRMVGGVNNINLIIGDALSQPHKEGYFDRIIFAAAGPLEISKKENQKIMKEDIKKDGLLNHLVKQAKIGGIIVLPMGKLHTRWGVECHGNSYRIRNLEDHLDISIIDQEDSWTPLVGEYGFSEEEIKEKFSWKDTLYNDAL